jgi:hypothetical protein
MMCGSAVRTLGSGVLRVCPLLLNAKDLPGFPRGVSNGHGKRRQDQAASNRETCLASQRSRPAGVRTPRGDLITYERLVQGVSMCWFGRMDSKSDLVAEIEIVAETGRRQPKYGDSRPDVARNQKARSRKKQRNGGGPVPVACKGRQHHGKGGAGHHHPANRSGDFLLVHLINLKPAARGPGCADCRPLQL